MRRERWEGEDRRKGGEGKELRWGNEGNGRGGARGRGREARGKEGRGARGRRRETRGKEGSGFYSGKGGEEFVIFLLGVPLGLRKGIELKGKKMAKQIEIKTKSLRGEKTGKYGLLR